MRRLLVECKSVGEPRYLAQAITVLRLASQQVPQSYPVVAAPYIGPEGQRLCREARVGYLDLAGNAFLHFDGVLVDRRSGERPPRAKARLRRLFSPRSSRILRVLLERPEQEWTLARLAAEAAISLRTAHLVVNALEEKAFLEKRRGAIRLQKPGALLDLMPDPSRPPINLKPDDLRAVIAYLQSLGGAADVAAIKLPAALLARAAQAAPAEAWAPYVAGDAKAGAELFFAADSNAACGKCHVVNGKGGTVGPELTGVAGTREPRFIIESILEPSKVIASGYEPILLITKDSQYLSGIIKKEDADMIELVDSQAKAQRVPKAQIQQRSPQKASLMPGNFGEILTVQEFHDLLAFLLAQK